MQGKQSFSLRRKVVASSSTLSSSFSRNKPSRMRRRCIVARTTPSASSFQRCDPSASDVMSNICVHFFEVSQKKQSAGHYILFPHMRDNIHSSYRRTAYFCSIRNQLLGSRGVFVGYLGTATITTVLKGSVLCPVAS